MTDQRNKPESDSSAAVELFSAAVVAVAAYFTGALDVGMAVLKATWRYIYTNDGHAQIFFSWTPLTWTISAVVVAFVAVAELLVLLAVSYPLRVTLLFLAPSLKSKNRHAHTDSPSA